MKLITKITTTILLTGLILPVFGYTLSATAKTEQECRQNPGYGYNSNNDGGISRANAFALCYAGDFMNQNSDYKNKVIGTGRLNYCTRKGYYEAVAACVELDMKTSRLPGNEECHKLETSQYQEKKACLAKLLSQSPSTTAPTSPPTNRALPTNKAKPTTKITVEEAYTLIGLKKPEEIYSTYKKPEFNCVNTYNSSRSSTKKNNLKSCLQNAIKKFNKAKPDSQSPSNKTKPTRSSRSSVLNTGTPTNATSSTSCGTLKTSVERGRCMMANRKPTPTRTQAPSTYNNSTNATDKPECGLFGCGTPTFRDDKGNAIPDPYTPKKTTIASKLPRDEELIPR